MSGSAQPPPPPFTDDTTAQYSGYAGATRASTIPDGVGFWPRAGARVIDTLLHSVIAVAAGSFMRTVVFSAPATALDLDTLAARLAGSSPLNFLVGFLGFVAYHTVCEGLHGSSLGKFLLGQVVVTDQVRPCGLRAALIRSLAYLVDILFFGLVGYLAMRRTRLQKRHGDNWAGTFVARRSQVPIGSLRGRFGGVLALALAVDAAILMAYFAIKMM
ncbi:MAG: RDD family protein [Terriglobales bacterium]